MITFHVDDWWNITVLPVPFFLKNQVDTSCISQEFLYKLFFDLTNQQLTCTPVHLVLGVFCIHLNDRERTHALLLNPPEFSMGGATQKWPLRNHISEMFFEIRPIKYDRNVKQVCLSRRRDWPHVLILAVVQSSCELKNYWNLQWCNLNDAIYFKSNQLLNL